MASDGQGEASLGDKLFTERAQFKRTGETASGPAAHKSASIPRQAQLGMVQYLPVYKFLGET